jgi:electron transport complex protein RnfB
MSPLEQAVLAVLCLLVIGVLAGVVIGLVVRFFGAETDPRIEQVEGLLPGANCGGCGFAGCTAFAEALVTGKATDPALCPSNAAAAIGRICALLGLSASERKPQVAVVMCGGDRERATEAALYNGVADCTDAMLVAGGAKGCRYGCLGLASCARACPFGAIEITDSGIARVHSALCTGCGKCVRTCPRKLIRLVPRTAPVHVLCSSPEKGAAKRTVCKAACIACRKCVKAAGEEHMSMNGFLAVVNYGDPPPPTVSAVCPTGCLVPTVAADAGNGVPAEAHEVAHG